MKNFKVRNTQIYITTESLRKRLNGHRDDIKTNLEKPNHAYPHNPYFDSCYTTKSLIAYFSRKPFDCLQLLRYNMNMFTAGYNNVEVAELLLERGADVNAQDKGGLIPLHNASSYGHLDIAALLIKFNTVVNATDKWGFTPLHEAAQKGRTQLSALLVCY